MGVIQRFCHSPEDLHHRLPGQGALLRNQVIQTGTIDQVHDDEQPLGHLQHIVNGHDAGMVQPGDGPRFPLEARHPRAVGQEALAQLLQGHLPLQFGVLGPVDQGKATLAQRFHNSVSSQLLSHLFSSS